MNNIRKYETQIAGKKLEVEFSDLALNANGSALVRYGDTTVLATATMSKNPRTGIDFFPLSVDYEEKFYAAGQILGSRFIRREGRPSEEAVLNSRLIDRTLRPLFNKKIRNEVHVVVMALAIDGENDPDIAGILAASLAIATSDIPWAGPVSPLRIGLIDGKTVFNPVYAERENSNLDLVACAKEGKINMLEAGAKEASEEKIMEALEKTLPEFAEIEKFQKKIISEIGKEKMKIDFPVQPPEMLELFDKHIKPRLADYLYASDKSERNTLLGELKKEWMDTVSDQFSDFKNEADQLYEKTIDDIVHKNILENDLRPDRRGLGEIRSLFAQAGFLKRNHGSAIFYRGETHILSVATLGAPGDVQLVEGMEVQTKKRFMHHYNFPPFSSGETGRIGSPGRREIGHGALAERALQAVIPPKEIFPYTIRLVSETMSSNGSTSMGAVCASTLSLMDAGVPIKEPVAGIAMGLMMSEDGKRFKVLTDIQGPEDHHGDMDFKVAGTRNGVTAIQMDVKVDGIPLKILAEALESAKKARFEILDVIEKEISAPRPKISPNAPEILIVKINQDQIGGVIGSGGKTIKEIKEKTGAEIDIEDDGSVFITGKNGSAQKAKEIIEQMTHEYKAGEKFENAEVIKIMEFGAFVKIAHNTEGLVHISEIAPFRIDKVENVLKEGDIVPVVIKEIDAQKRLKLSIKDANPNFIKKPEAPKI